MSASAELLVSNPIPETKKFDYSFDIQELSVTHIRFMWTDICTRGGGMGIGKISAGYMGLGKLYRKGGDENDICGMDGDGFMRVPCSCLLRLLSKLCRTTRRRELVAHVFKMRTNIETNCGDDSVML